MKTSSFISMMFLSSILSAQILTINTVGDYTLKSGESEEHGVKVATELAKQIAIEKAGTAVVSSFRMERSSDGTDKAVLNATTYAAAIVKTSVDGVENDEGHLTVSITATIDDSKVEEYLKGGPALHDKMAELKRSNDDLQDALAINLRELQDLDTRYSKALQGSVDESELQYLKGAIAKKISDTDTLLNSIGEFQTKTGHLFMPKGSLLKTALRQQLNASQTEYDKKVLMGAYDSMLSWLTQNVKVSIDPSSIKLSAVNGKTDIALSLVSTLENKDYALSPLAKVDAYGKMTAMHEFPYYSVFSDEVKSTLENTTLKMPYLSYRNNTMKDSGGRSATYKNPSFDSIPWSRFTPKNKKGAFDCSMVKDQKTIPQCELNRYAFSKVLVIRVGVEGTNSYVDIPLHKVYGQNDYSKKINQGVVHALSVSDHYSATIKGVSSSDLAKADDFYTKVMIVDSMPSSDYYNEIDDLTRSAL